MQRRAFLVGAGQTVAFGLAAGATRARLSGRQTSPISPDALEQRVARVIQAYDAQGNHRTGTEVDNASAEWLAGEVRQLGVKPSLEPFLLSRVDPQLAYLRIADRRVDGVPMFDAGFTSAAGVSGRIGPLGSDAEIGLAETLPYKLTETTETNILIAARRSRHKAVVLVTGGNRPGLFLMNALAFIKPAGPPMLQISSVESTWLNEQAQKHAEVTLVAQVNRRIVQAFNVTVRITGRDRNLGPLVFVAPRSGWWQCASEQGSRLVCWLEVMRALAAVRPRRDCLFVAMSGHELAFMGINPYLRRRPGLIKHAEAWIFFGSDIGAPRQPNLIQASDDALERWIVTALENERLAVDTEEQHSSIARGEMGTVQRGGGRFVTLACASQVYHNAADRWPEAIDVSRLARHARALASGALDLA
ncbi:MAG TPA: hypothetical protein VE422_07835 [Terriglobia bacterium]|nr:hypothetical protein [Terriglobia bacterium]